jgi:acetyl-CoA C-acetyltransferase
VLVAGARTPIGKLLGGLFSLTAPELGAAAIRAARDRARITGDQVDAVIMGNVVQAGVGPNPARLAAVAGGMEYMSGAPHLLPGSRLGYRYGDAVFLDSLDQDALVCGFDGISMGAATERYQASLGISRRDQDAFAAESHARAAAAIKDGRRSAPTPRSPRLRRRSCRTAVAPSS